jgi:hypothetical protein
MDIEINLDKKKSTEGSKTKVELDVDNIKFQKMIFLYNALENGWSIKKRQKSYIFSKNHEGKKEVFDDSYLAIFIKDNVNINNILS